ncbi:unnamed protein product [Ixodes hexagonus]
MTVHEPPHEASLLSGSFGGIGSDRDWTFCRKAIIKGTTYIVDDYVLVSGNRFDVMFGVVTGIMSNGSGQVAFMVQCVQANLLPAMCVYSLQSPTGDAICVNQEELLDFTPYRPYSFGEVQVIRLNFAFPEKL